MDAAKWLPLLTELADRADAISMRWFQRSDLPVDRKPDRSLVTKADLEVEEAIREIAARQEPALGILGEEHGEDRRDAAARLIVDPIDATANFARGLPVFATLLAIEVDGEIVAGLASAPALHRRWHAARGHGAYENGRQLHVSAVSRLEDAQIFHGSLFGPESVPNSAKIPALLARTWRQRGVGDFWQHLLVAQGCGEAALDPIVAPWDVAPLVVIIEEAGGRATTVGGTRSIRGGSLITSNGHLHDEILAAFA